MEGAWTCLQQKKVTQGRRIKKLDGSQEGEETLLAGNKEKGRAGVDVSADQRNRIWYWNNLQLWPSAIPEQNKTTETEKD